jgi:sugar-phosphatase
MNPPLALQCSAILFDLDGVLVDSRCCVERTWHRWAVQHRLDPDRVMEVAHGRRTVETIKVVAPHLDANAEARALEISEATTTDGVFEITGARALLSRLPAGSWAIVTSGIRAVATLRVRHTHLPMPKVLVCADEIQRGKPDPEGYLIAADRLGHAADGCVVIEDTPPGLEAARAAGMRAIGVSGTYPTEALAIADWTIPHLTALGVARADHGSLLELSLKGF